MGPNPQEPEIRRTLASQREKSGEVLNMWIYLPAQPRCSEGRLGVDVGRQIVSYSTKPCQSLGFCMEGYQSYSISMALTFAHHTVASRYFLATFVIYVPVALRLFQFEVELVSETKATLKTNDITSNAVLRGLLGSILPLNLCHPCALYPRRSMSHPFSALGRSDVRVRRIIKWSQSAHINEHSLQRRWIS